MKIIAMAGTHYVGIITHFTGPIAEAALVQCLTASITGLIEMFAMAAAPGPTCPRMQDFKEGKLWPNDRPGLGVEVDTTKLTKIGEYDTYREAMLMNQRRCAHFGKSSRVCSGGGGSRGYCPSLARPALPAEVGLVSVSPQVSLWEVIAHSLSRSRYVTLSEVILGVTFTTGGRPRSLAQHS